MADTASSTGDATAAAGIVVLWSEKVETGAVLLVGVGGLASEAGLVGGEVRIRLQDSPKVVMSFGFPETVVCLAPLVWPVVNLAPGPGAEGGTPLGPAACLGAVAWVTAGGGAGGGADAVVGAGVGIEEELGVGTGAGVGTGVGIGVEREAGVGVGKGAGAGAVVGRGAGAGVGTGAEAVRVGRGAAGTVASD